MLLVPCPICGPRAEVEFEYGGACEPSTLDKPWARANIKGEQKEFWWHRFGCGQWFTCVRDTRTHEFCGQSRLLSAQESEHSKE